MIAIKLPDTFGTGTLHGMFFENICGGEHNPQIADTMKHNLGYEILVVIPRPINAKLLQLVADESISFTNWAEKTFGVRPNLLFV